jgi:glutamate-ammonia-ligase adenylyltransferase
MLSAELQDWFLKKSLVRDVARGRNNLHGLARHVGEARLASWLPDWQPLFAASADADMALNNLEQIFAAPDAGSALEEVLAKQPNALELLVSLAAASQFLSDTLALQPQAVALLGLPLRHTPTKAELTEELQSAMAKTFEDSSLLQTIRLFRGRHMLRIGINDIVRDRPLEEITADISLVAEAAVCVALASALQTISNRFGQPVTADGGKGRVAVLAFGKLGGNELNYSSDIDLMIVFDKEGQTTRLEITLEEFYSRATTEMLRLLSAAYRVDFRLRPEGQRGPLVRSLASTLSYYDMLGRTWERQALIKIRPIAGDFALGQEFLRLIEPFVYRKYLSFGEIQEIKAIKRKIEQRATRQGESLTDVKTGYGGIRDVEFVIQFLQLLNGGDLPLVRGRNTLLAIQALTQVGCLSSSEGERLESSYRFLRRTEHRLQLMSDLQTHRLPEHAEEFRPLALRLGYSDGPQRAETQFRKQLTEMTRFNRTLLDRLLHDAFPDQESKEEPEADLILLPEIEVDAAQGVLGRYGFKEIGTALRNLQQLAQEPVPFLPTRRCRHFLAGIAQPLLQALSETPDPDMALTNLERVTASLGAKGVLWELFSLNPPSLRLYVELCAWSPFLSQILTSHPGMIDELLDSLILDQPRSLAELQEELAELCRGADPQLVDRTLHSFQNKELLHIGVCDILGKTPLPETLAALSDLAEALLGQMTAMRYAELCRRWGQPCLDQTALPCRFVLVGLGKFGGREMSYQSDLDLVLIYEGDGETRPLSLANSESGVPGRVREDMPSGATTSRPGESTDNVHFFSELAQQIIHGLGHLGPSGRLYQVDMRLRPTGKSGTLAVPLEGFRQYYAQGQGQLWERQALTRARIVHGEPIFGEKVMAAVHAAAYGPSWQASMAEEILAMRKRLEASRPAHDLKRGLGGIVDVEFLVQLLQLKYGGQHPRLRQPNLWQALQALAQAGVITPQQAGELGGHYDALRQLQSRLRIVYPEAQDQLPESPEAIGKLARRLGYMEKPPLAAAARFLAELQDRMNRMRGWFLQMARKEMDETIPSQTPAEVEGSGNSTAKELP